jgi:hypothetical protein
MLGSKMGRDWKVKPFFLPKADRVFSLPSGKREIQEQIPKILLILSENMPEALTWPLLGVFLIPLVLPVVAD